MARQQRKNAGIRYSEAIKMQVVREVEQDGVACDHVQEWHSSDGDVPSWLMRIPLKTTFCTLVWLAANSRTQAQGTFQNLDFEAAAIQQTQAPGDVSVTSALPGWTVDYGTNQQTTVWYNQAALGSTHVDLLGTNRVPAGSKSIEGEFSVLLQGGVSGSGPNLFATAASIKQMGVLPAGSQSIIFKALGEPGTFTVSLDAVNIPYFALSSGPGYTVYGGDISSFAGQTAELEFALSRLPGTDYSNWNLDSIQFSELAIPEPSVVHLFALGALVVVSRLLRNEG